MTKPAKSRLDELLVRRGFADSVTTAQAMIMSGDVVVDDQRIDKAGTLIKADAVIRVKDDGKFVSRGGDKLEGALLDLGLIHEIKGKIFLDIGASTGGFTDCVLTHGASQVVAVDVGTAQLAWKLRQDPRVKSIEKTDIRDLATDDLPDINWVVADVSFTSLARLIPDIHRIVPKASLLLLVKPQFELPREKIPDGGIVTNENDRRLALEIVRHALEICNYKICGEIDARISGKQGNREIFIYAVPNEKRT